MQDADFESLITNGTVLSRNQVCCVNQNHLDRCSRDLIAPGTPDKPFDYNTFVCDVVMGSLAAGVVRARM